MRVLELHDPAAIDADQMIVRGLVEEVGIVGRLVVAKINFAQQVRLYQQAQRAINRGTRSLGIEFPGAVEQLICSEMLVFGESRLDDGIALTGPAQSFAPDEIVEPFLDAAVHSPFLMPAPHHGKRKENRLLQIQSRVAFLSILDFFVIITAAVADDFNSENR